MATFTATRSGERRASDFVSAGPARANKGSRGLRWFAASRWLAMLELETLPNCRINDKGNGVGNAAHPDSAQTATRDFIRSGNSG